MSNQYHYHLHDSLDAKEVIQLKATIYFFSFAQLVLNACYDATQGQVLEYGREQAPTLASTLELVICLEII